MLQYLQQLDLPGDVLFTVRDPPELLPLEDLDGPATEGLRVEHLLDLPVGSLAEPVPHDILVYHLASLLLVLVNYLGTVDSLKEQVRGVQVPVLVHLHQLDLLVVQPVDSFGRALLLRLLLLLLLLGLPVLSFLVIFIVFSW